MMKLSNIKSLIKWLREEGAYEVRIGESTLEAKFDKHQEPIKKEPSQLSPEVKDRAKKLKDIFEYQSKEIESEKVKQDEEDLLFWSS